MPNVYVEPRPKGRPEGSADGDYVVEDHADHVLTNLKTTSSRIMPTMSSPTFKIQHEAVEWAKKNGHRPLVARVRHLNDKKKPDHWRAVRES
jgi:hypothetical protein